MQRLIVRLSEQISDKLYVGDNRRLLQAAALDVTRAIAALPRLFGQAMLDISQRYRRSILGPFWLVIGKVALALGYSTLGSQIFKMDTSQFLLYVLAGIAVWQFISSCFLDAVGMYLSDTGTLTSSHPSLSSFCVRVVIRQFLILLHSVPVILALAWSGGVLNANTLWLPVSMAAVMLALLPAVLVTGLLSTRLRDVGQLVTVVMQFAVFLTPVFWMASSVPEGTNGKLILDLNPFHHILEILRSPMLGVPIAPEHWFGFAVFTGLSLIFAVFLFPALRGRLVYWL